MKRALAICYFVFCFWVTFAQWQEHRFVPLADDFGMDVHDITQDEYGYIYVCGSPGFLRYDGSKFHHFKHDPNDSSSVAPGYIVEILTAKDGMIWLATKAGTLCKYNPKTEVFKTYHPPHKNGAYFSSFASIEEDENGIIWLGGYHFQLFEFNPESEEFKVYVSDKLNPKTHPGRLMITSLIQDRKNSEVFWLTVLDVNYGKAIDYGHILVSFNRQTKKFKYFDEVGRSFHIDKKNRIWGTGHVKSISCYNIESDSTSMYFVSPAYSDTVVNWRLRCILFDDDETYVGTESGVYRFKENGSFKLWPGSEQFGAVACLFKDRQGNIWMGGHRGLQVAMKSPIRYFPYSTFGRHIDIYPAQTIYDVRTDNFLLTLNHEWEKRFDRLLFEIPRSNKRKPVLHEFNNPIRHFTFDKEHNLWLFHLDNKLDSWRIAKSGLVKNKSPMAGSIPHSVKQIKPFNDSLLVAISSRHVAVINTKSYSIKLHDFDSLRPSISKGYMKNYLRGHLVLNDSSCLVSSNELVKLNIFTGNITDIKLGSVKNNGVLFFLGMTYDANDGLWLANGEKLFLGNIAGDSLILEKEFNIDDGFHSMGISKVYADQFGRVWTFGLGGIYGIDIHSHEVRYFGVSSGLPHTHISNEPAIELPDGSIAYTEFHNLVHFHPDTLWNSIEPRNTQVVIQEIRLDGVSVPRGKYLQQPLKLKKHDQTVDIAFQGISYPTADKLDYQYRILGLNDDWISVGSNNFISLPKLASGDYTFQVTSGPASDIAAYNSLDISVPTPFYLSWWFLGLAACMLVVAGVLLYKRWLNVLLQRHNRELARQQETMQLELKALRAQMNPHFMFNSLNSIKNFILTSDARSAAKYLSSFSHLIRQILQHSREKKISLLEELDLLKLYLELEKLRFKTDFEYFITMEDDMDSESIYLPPMILQPFIENAIWHGLGTKSGERFLWIKFKLIEKDLLCVIEDNGIGRAAANRKSRSESKKHKSMGMEITQQRLELINELEKLDLQFNIVDLIDKNDDIPLGTRVEIKIPQSSYQF